MHHLSPLFPRRVVRTAARSALAALPLLFTLMATGSGAGCGHRKPTADRLMGSTSIGKNRCSEVDPTDRPFVVEWDATDTAMFESFAQRDVMFVRYEGCELELLTACTDDGLAGRYGAYNPPMWTSGSIEGFEVRDEYDLYAKLPLGASSLSGKIASGATLSLEYFISGMVTSTRTSIGEQDIAGNPRCSSATHFVQAYNLGAFQLDATEGNEQRLSATHMGAGGAGGHSRSEAHLKRGGDLASCTAQEAKELTRCQVPIRLVLRTLDEGATTELSAPAPTAVVEAGPDGAAGTAKNLAGLVESAMRKSGAGDGAGCIADLNRAKKVDGRSDKLYPQIRAQCEMQAGQCAAGMKRYRKWQNNNAGTGNFSASDRDAAVINMAVTHCKGKGIPDVVRAIRLSEAIETAKRRPDAPACARQGTKLLPLVGKMPTRDATEKGRKSMAAGALKTAATCADSLGRCKDAKKLIAGAINNNDAVPAKDRSTWITAERKRLERCGG
ncbi:MAG: hypothetical protein K0V04_02515 [Deltaproteobacteria bacterium]|nr:hypothetical protein [Deltaproteobacteria bacterium]